MLGYEYCSVKSNMTIICLILSKVYKLSIKPHKGVKVNSEQKWTEIIASTNQAKYKIVQTGNETHNHNPILHSMTNYQNLNKPQAWNQY